MSRNKRKKNNLSNMQSRAEKITRDCKQNNEAISVDIKTHRDKNGGHFHIIMDDIDNKHVSVGLSTQRTKGKNGAKNYSMEKSPLNDGKHSYMRRQATIAPKKEYYNPQKGSLTRNDYDVAKRYSNRAKEKYLANKDKKK